MDSFYDVSCDEELHDVALAFDWGSHDGGEHVGSCGGIVHAGEVVACPVLLFILWAAEGIAGALFTVVVDESIAVEVTGLGGDFDAGDVFVGDFKGVHGWVFLCCAVAAASFPDTTNVTPHCFLTQPTRATPPLYPRHGRTLPKFWRQ